MIAPSTIIATIISLLKKRDSKGRCTPTYNTWRNMKQRCLNSNATGYIHYGGRGITVCAEWVKSFAQFVLDCGVREEGTTIDRIDVNGSYEIGNVRWSDAITQANNKRGSLGEWEYL